MSKVNAYSLIEDQMSLLIIRLRHIILIISAECLSI